ncbi:MAG TPA: precorrin-3B C(17)-methyltransferase [Frankiaceae bacterium]|nr:precorrin-3B C(17)-methyltransferase [Frankiaceae bacterium]
MIGLVTATAAGRTSASALEASWGDARSYPVADLAIAWGECDALVCFLAIGATVRLIAPLLADKQTDPGVVCVDEAARFAVAVVGGHHGANGLAERVAETLGAAAVITTATDSAGIPGLDTLGWPYEGEVAAVSRALLDGDPVTLWNGGRTWPLPAIAADDVAERPEAGPTILITDRTDLPRPLPSVLLRPPSLTIGVGASRGVRAEEVLELIRSTLADANLSAACIRELATVEAKAAEAGLLAAAEALDVPLTLHGAAVLAAIDVPNPSEVVRAAVDTPSVAEAAALAGGGDLLVAKRKSTMATVAVARREPRGRLAIVGIGPGDRELLTPRARAELRRSSVVVGLDQYVSQVADLLRLGTRVLATGLGSEQERAESAVEFARSGHAVALIGSGDAGIYAMASPALEAADDSFDVIGTPGVTAMLAAAALLGAPLGHDHAAISLSDLHTPWEIIERRVTAAAQGDFVVAFYNPRSRGREWQLGKCLAILASHRPADTPVGVVSDASRPGQRVALSTLADVDPQTVGMTSLVIVGAASSRVVAGRFVTPRGYTWRQ